MWIVPWLWFVFPSEITLYFALTKISISFFLCSNSILLVKDMEILVNAKYQCFYNRPNCNYGHISRTRVSSGTQMVFCGVCFTIKTGMSNAGLHCLKVDWFNGRFYVPTPLTRLFLPEDDWSYESKNERWENLSVKQWSVDAKWTQKRGWTFSLMLTVFNVNLLKLMSVALNSGYSELTRLAITSRKMTQRLWKSWSVLVKVMRLLTGSELVEEERH